jgi:hypothetical protein
VLLVFFFHLREYENVIDKDHNKFIQVLHKQLIHKIHEIG